MNLLIPKRAFFNFAFACPFRADAPVLDGDLKDWDERFRVPDLMEVEGGKPFADFYMAWNDAGLYFAVHVRKAAGMGVQTKLKGDGLEVWVDTRDVRDAHRAGRYCHHFYFLPGRGSRKPVGGQARIRRARAQGKLCDPGRLGVASKVTRTGYRMEIHVPAEALRGFDPEENNRLGFTYLLKDRKLGRQCWTADEPLPVSYDPSLWGTVELVRD